MSIKQNLANLPEATRQQLVAELTELVQAKYGRQLKNIEITEEDIQAYQPGQLAEGKMLDNVLDRLGL